MFESIDLEKLFGDSLAWLQSHILTTDFAVQLALVGFALAIGSIVRKKLLPKIQPAISDLNVHYRTKLTLNNICRLIMQITAFLIILIGSRIAATDLAGAVDVSFAEAVMALLAAWIFIRLVLQFIQNRIVRNIFAFTIWSVAALAIFGILDETTGALDALGMNVGDFRISALTVIKGLMALFVLMYTALFLSSLLERKVQSATSLTVSSTPCPASSAATR